MSNIPEHLLQRSREAKAAKLGGSVPEATSSSSEIAATAASAATATSVEPAGPPAIVELTQHLPYLDDKDDSDANKPEPVNVQAFKKRKRAPFWAMPVVVALPFWAYGYAGTLQEPETDDPLYTHAAELYETCAGCHGATGGGGSGYPLANGSVNETFPSPIDQMVHVARGSAAISGQEYGAQRSDGTRKAGNLGVMPAQLGQLKQNDLEMVIFHERVVLGGEDATAPEYEAWMEHMREAYEANDETDIDLDFLLACADPTITPEATGVGSDDPEGRPCPGPLAES